MLHLMERGGQLRDIESQVSVYLTDARIQYIVDFRAVEARTGVVEYHEGKGMDTPVWRLKRRLWQFYGPGRLVVWVAGVRGEPAIKEVIQSKAYSESPTT